MNNQPELFDTARPESYSPAELFIRRYDIRFWHMVHATLKPGPKPWTATLGYEPCDHWKQTMDAKPGYGETRLEAAMNCARANQIEGWDRVKWG